MKKIMLFIGITLVIFLGLQLKVTKMNIEHVAGEALKEAGRLFVEHVAEGVIAFPRNDGSTEAEQSAFLQEQWRKVLLSVSSEYRDQRSKYYNANIWAAVKNLPEKPPRNLIVLATRNIDSSILGTGLTERDMQKRIHFDEQFVPPKNIPVLKKYAAVIFADGRGLIVWRDP